jgi:GTP-binding protein
MPEVAFAGRSNAVSKTPGRTQLINFFTLGGAYLVDLPGYGYAGVPADVRRHWDYLVGSYVAERRSLVAVIVVMDVRHPLTPLDVQLLGWLREARRPAHVLLTKADKLSRQAAQRTLARVRRDLEEVMPGASVQLFSSFKPEGIAEAAGKLAFFAAKKQSPG